MMRQEEGLRRVKEVWSEGLGWIPTFRAMLIGMKDIVTVMMDVEVEMTVSGEMIGVIEGGKGREGSKNIEILDEGGVEVLNEIVTGSFIGGEPSPERFMKSNGMAALKAGSELSGVGWTKVSVTAHDSTDFDYAESFTEAKLPGVA